AFSLNLRVEAAQTPVSMLGMMLRILRLPAKLLRLISSNPWLVRVKPGAVAPFCGKLPPISMGLPSSDTLLMKCSFEAEDSGCGELQLTPDSPLWMQIFTVTSPGCK